MPRATPFSLSETGERLKGRVRGTGKAGGDNFLLPVKVYSPTGYRLRLT
uniref:Uncharacterized protein n=1 Tax=Escherichia coli TaxID=562 RepID=A0A7U1E261_ECOLX|nr:hypothetical protein [Escherichia coli]